MESNNFITDSELTGYINNSISELHDLLIQTYDGDYYVNDVEFTTSSAQSSYNLSTVITDDNFYKLRGVDAKINGSDWNTLQPFTFNERNRAQNSISGVYSGINNVKYRLVGNTIRFTPIPDNNIQIRLWYIPVAVTLVNDSDTLTDLNNFSEYVIVDAAIKMLQKEESDVTVLMAQKANLKRRIEEAAGNRDAGQGESISDIYNEYFLERILN
jgi:uncharacterized protein YdcH (DUF465 family)